MVSAVKFIFCLGGPQEDLTGDAMSDAATTSTLREQPPDGSKNPLHIRTVAQPVLLLYNTPAE
jgi:hypothetical protein